MCEMQNEEDQGKPSNSELYESQRGAHGYNSAMVRSLAEDARMTRRFAQPALEEPLPSNRLLEGK
jgi:hypothetical protein